MAMCLRPRLLLLVPALLLLSAGHGPLSAQPSDSIVANPNAVKLRRIWTIVGKEEEQSLGSVGGSVGDINGDGLGDFGVLWVPNGRANPVPEFRVFYGGSPAPDTIADWFVDSITEYPSQPVWGNFWGDGHNGLVLGTIRPADTVRPGWGHFALVVFRVDSNRLPDEPTIRQRAGQIYCIADYAAADLDGDGADELIVSEVCDADLTRTLIYKGGPGFQLDSPTVVVNDGEGSQSRNYVMQVGDVDGDGKPDLATGGWYGSAGVKLKFWLGATGSLLAGKNPDLVVPLVDATATIDCIFTLLDVDNDGYDDLLRGIVNPPKRGIYLTRSSVTGTILSRSFLVDSADHKWTQSNLRGHASAGYLIDSTYHYEAVRIYLSSPYDSRSIMMIGLGGGPTGPNSTYDAWYAPERDKLSAASIFNRTQLIPDCNGDGWEDFFAGNFEYGGFNRGIALVLAGGPYIPRDDPTTSVQDIGVAGKPRAITVWPNPARQEVNIAWRGDLRAMPRRFEAHRLSGELVARGEVEPYRGSALWRCEGLAAGTYLLTIFDADGGVIATARVVKEE